MENSHIVGEVVKNGRGEKVVVTEIREDEDLKYVDIRQGYTSDNGEFILTKKGIRIKVDKFEELRDLINSITL